MTTNKGFPSAKSLPRHFAKDRKGIAALEFALIFPVMLLLYLGSVEIGLAINTNKNIGKVSSSVADLLTQSETVSVSDISSIAQIGEAIMLPYDETKPTITMVGIKIEDKPNPTKAHVTWSRKYSNGSMTEPLAPGSEIAIPANLMIQDTFVVMSTAEITYIPIIGYVAHANGTAPNIDMAETYYLRPRMSDTVTCTNC